MSSNKSKTSTRSFSPLYLRFKQFYQDKLFSIAVSTRYYRGLPEEIPQDYFAKTLLTQGSLCFYRDEVMNQFVALPFIYDGNMLSIYNLPSSWTAYSLSNPYRYSGLNDENSVLIWYNATHDSILNMINLYSDQLAELACAYIGNARSAKYPMIIGASQENKLSMAQLWKEFDEGSPAIFIKDSKMQTIQDDIQAFPVNTPFVAPEIWSLMQNVWNDALESLGIRASHTNGKMAQQGNLEIATAQGSVGGFRSSQLMSQEYAIDKINKMFGLNIEIEYMSDVFIEPDGTEIDEEDIDREEVTDNG